MPDGPAPAAGSLTDRLQADGHVALEDLAFVRVYIKAPSHYKQTRAVCEARLGELPTIYAIADVCRPELLVEIEGIAFSSRCVR